MSGGSVLLWEYSPQPQPARGTPLWWGYAGDVLGLGSGTRGGGNRGAGVRV